MSMQQHQPKHQSNLLYKPYTRHSNNPYGGEDVSHSGLLDQKTNSSSTKSLSSIRRSSIKGGQASFEGDGQKLMQRESNLPKDQLVNTRGSSLSSLPISHRNERNGKKDNSQQRRQFAIPKPVNQKILNTHNPNPQAANLTSNQFSQYINNSKAVVNQSSSSSTHAQAFSKTSKQAHSALLFPDRNSSSQSKSINNQSTSKLSQNKQEQSLHLGKRQGPNQSASRQANQSAASIAHSQNVQLSNHSINRRESSVQQDQVKDKMLGLNSNHIELTSNVQQIDFYHNKNEKQIFEEENRCKGAIEYQISKPFSNENQNYSSSLVIKNSQFTPEPHRNQYNRTIFSQTLLPNQMISQAQIYDNDSANYIQRCQESLSPPSNDVSTNAFSQNMDMNQMQKSSNFRRKDEEKEEPVKICMMNESPFGRGPELVQDQFSPQDNSFRKPIENSQTTEPQTMTTNTLSELLPFAPSTFYQKQMNNSSVIRNLKSQGAAQKAHENQGQMSLSSLNAASNPHHSSFGVSPQMQNGRNSLIKATATGERYSFGQQQNLSAAKSQMRNGSLNKKANQNILTSQQKESKSNARPSSQSNLSSIQKPSQGIYSKIGQQINSAIKFLEPPSSTSSQGSEQLPKPHPSNQKSPKHQSTFDNRQQSKQAGYNGLLLFPKELSENNQMLGSPSVTDIPLSVQKEIDILQKQRMNSEKENGDRLPQRQKHSMTNLGYSSQSQSFAYPRQIQSGMTPKSSGQNMKASSTNYQAPLALGYNQQSLIHGIHPFQGNFIIQEEGISNSILNNSSQLDMKGFFSNRTSCYDRAEMDEKFLDDPNMSQCYKVVHHSNQQNMLKEITNRSNQQVDKVSVLDSKKDTNTINDYSITQFNMNALMTPHMNETMTLHGGKDYRPSTHTLIPMDNSSIIYGNYPPSVLSVGEENIQNEESPHKCHSIQAYHISTFFNKDQQMKFLSFLNSQHQIPQFASQQQQQLWQQHLQQVKAQEIYTNQAYLRAFPKANFEVPKQNQHENVSVSNYETPINQSLPQLSITELTNEQIVLLQMNQQDMSMFSGSNLNTSNPVEVVSSIYGMTMPQPGQINFQNNQILPDFGQNNSKKIQQNFNFNQTQKVYQINNQLDLNVSQKNNEKRQDNANCQSKGGHIKLQNCFNDESDQMDITNELADETFQEVITAQVEEKEVIQGQQLNHQNSDIHRQHLIQTFNALQTIPHLDPYQKVYLNKERVYLPPPKNLSLKKVLILDIDETMIHCLDERDPDSEEPDIVIRIPLDDDEENGEYADAGINIRPHLFECLRQANEYYQVIAFTASDQQYANAILDYIDPSRTLIQYRLYRQHCIETEFGYIKDLRVIANRDLKDMVLVDNSVLSFAMQLENGIPILPFYVNRADEELLHLVYYLKCLVEQEDVRLHNKEAFGLNKLAVMDLQQIMNSSSQTNNGVSVQQCDPNAQDYQCDLIEENSNQNSQIMQENELDDSAEMMSPNTKIKNVKQKYQPNDMDQINEDSMESDITSSVISKKVKSVNSLNNFSQKVSQSYSNYPLQTNSSNMLQKIRQEQNFINDNPKCSNLRNNNENNNQDNSLSYYHMAQSENQVRMQTKQQQLIDQNTSHAPQYKHQYLMQLQNQYLHQSSSNNSGRDVSSITSSSNAFDNFLGGSIRYDSSSLLNKTPQQMNGHFSQGASITNLKMMK